MPQLIGILMFLALSAPVAVLADTSAPSQTIGIVPTNDQPAELGNYNRFGKRGEHGSHGAVQPVPEPGTFALLAMGAVAVSAPFRRRMTRRAPNAAETSSPTV